jgi:NHL repeat/WD40-like Beta Propeller Repeat
MYTFKQQTSSERKVLHAAEPDRGCNQSRTVFGSSVCGRESRREKESRRGSIVAAHEEGNALMRSLFKFGPAVGASRSRTAHRLVVASLCGLVCVLGAGAVTANAGVVSRFGSGGGGAGQLNIPLGVGVDQQSGDVYVGEFYNQRVSKFAGSGSFLFAWGWGVDAESFFENGLQPQPANELQTCTSATSCRAGGAGTGAGEFAGSCGTEGVAVDNDPTSASYKDVYVADFCNHRVQKFGPTGNFLLMFGGHVNETTGGDVCVLGEACTGGTEGSANGEFEWAYERSYIAVGPGGAVYVGDNARVQVFTPSGAWRENISLAGLSITGRVTELAVDASGDMFVKDEGIPGVHEFEADGAEKATQFDVGSESVEAITVDGSGDPFVEDSNGGFHLLEYDPVGKELAAFGRSGSQTLSFSHGIAYARMPDGSGELYVTGEHEYQKPAVTNKSYETAYEPEVWAFALPSPGPLIESESATPAVRGAATFEATVNPEGNETTYHFEYVDETRYQNSGFAGASSTPPVSIKTNLFEDQSARAEPTGLLPGGTYHYRIIASNECAVKKTCMREGADQSFEETPPALVEGPAASDVASTSATLSAKINPLGTDTDYRLEYGTSTSYGHVLSGNVGEGTSYVLLASHIQSLESGTTYHYRIVTTNQVGTIEGADHLFRTQTAGGVFNLPDGRAWELVTPPNKRGALIEPSIEGQIQAATDGGAVAYSSSEPLGEDGEGKVFLSQILSRRTSNGWTSQDIAIPHSLPHEGETAGKLLDTSSEYHIFSPDLSLGLVEPQSLSTPLSPEVTERTLYLRNDATGVYLPLVTEANVPPGTKFGAEPQAEMKFLVATPDLSHVIFQSPLALTPDAFSKPCLCGYNSLRNLYEWNAGRLRLVNVFPDGAPTPGEARLAGAGEYGDEGMISHSISSDGRRVVWAYGRAYAEPASLYVRDMVKDNTVRIGGPEARFEAMNGEGSKIFFLEKGELYEFDTDTGTAISLTSNHGLDEHNGGVKESGLGASADGSYVYVVATGVLASGGRSGEDNLYVLHDNGAEWIPTYIATLSAEDERTWYAPAFALGVDPAHVSSRVSPDGHYLAFMSNRPLTGYDNTDAVSGQPDEETYLYEAATDRLVCTSCNPSGARPTGVFDSNKNAGETLLVDRGSVWTTDQGTGDHWLAGSISGWRAGSHRVASYQPRNLLNNGRLFFESPDALVPQDTNGLEDVYQYEPVGVGSCASASEGFNERSQGCVNLISSGTSAGESAFMDASESGDDAFFTTASKLTTDDFDTSYDLYDAHVCSTALPCKTGPVSPPPCTSGDSCKVAPTPQPEIFGPAPSATFSGTGNVLEATKSVVKRKPKKSKSHAKHPKRKRKGKRAKKSRTHVTSRKGRR